jgi:hypothetical protein
VALGSYSVDHEAHGALKLDERARAVLRGEQAVQMRRDSIAHEAAAARRRIVDAGDGEPLGADDEALFFKLKDWRRTIGRSQGVPACVILPVTGTLAAIARRRPDTLLQATRGAAGVQVPPSWSATGTAVIEDASPGCVSPPGMCGECRPATWPSDALSNTPTAFTEPPMNSPLPPADDKPITVHLAQTGRTVVVDRSTA